MIHGVQCLVRRGEEGLASSPVRYDMLERLWRAATRHEVSLLAFGMGADEVRLVMEGERLAVSGVAKGLKVGTTRRALRTWGFELTWHDTDWRRVHGDELLEAVVWAHRAPLEAGVPSPLGSPWSSHRDLMLFRVAPFYDPRILAGRVDPGKVHLACGGRPLPVGWPPSGRAREPLVLLLRVAGAVHGRLPADRRCFRLFAHLALARGWMQKELAEALCVSDRRIRQLLSTPEPRLHAALVSLADPRLCRVP